MNSEKINLNRENLPTKEEEELLKNASWRKREENIPNEKEQDIPAEEKTFNTLSKEETNALFSFMSEEKTEEKLKTDVLNEEEREFLGDIFAPLKKGNEKESKIVQKDAPAEESEKTEEKIEETKKSEDRMKTVQEKLEEGVLYFDKKDKSKSTKKTEGESGKTSEKEKKSTVEQTETKEKKSEIEQNLREKMEKARNILATLKPDQNDPKYNLELKNYKDYRDALRNNLFEAKQKELENLPEQERNEKLNEFAGELFEKLYIEEAQSLKSKKLEIQAEKQKDQNILYKAFDTYRKLSLKTKLAVSVSLIVGGVAFGSVPAFATLLAGATATMRILGSGSTAIGIDAAIRRFQEKSNKSDYEKFTTNLKEEFKKEVEENKEKEKKATKILEMLDNKSEQLNEKLDNLSKKEKQQKWIRRGVVVLGAGAVGSGLIGKVVSKAFGEVYHFGKDIVTGGDKLPGIIEEVKSGLGIGPEHHISVGLKIGERGPEGAIIDYLKNTGVPEETAGKQAHLMFLDFMKSPEVSKLMAEKGLSGDKEAYLELMKHIKKGLIEITPEGKLKFLNMEYAANAFHKALDAAGEKAVEHGNVAEVGHQLVAQETYKSAEDAFYTNKGVEFNKHLGDYYEQTGKPEMAANFRETTVNIPTEIEADWDFVHNATHLSKEEYVLIKDMKVGNLLNKTYWGMTEETRLPIFEERDHLEVWRKIGLKNDILKIAAKLPDGEIQKVEGMNVHEFLKEYYIKPQVDAARLESLSEHAGITGEELTKQTVETLHNKVVENSETGVKTIFKYASDGKIENVAVSGKSNLLEAKKLFNENWMETIKKGFSFSLDKSIVENRAMTLLQYKQSLGSLEAAGSGSTPEAEFLRKQVDVLIDNTEKTYGDVFK